MRRIIWVVMTTVALWSVAACLDVTPTSPLGTDEEKEEMREMVEKVKALAAKTAEGVGKDSDLVASLGEFEVGDEEFNPDAADEGMVRLVGGGAASRLGVTGPVHRVTVVRCAPEMMLERPLEGGVFVVVAGGGTRRVIDDER